MDLRNKVVLITGAASGLGAETARRLAKEGALLALVDQDAEQLASVAASLDALALVAEVTDVSSMEQAIAKTLKQWGAIHVAVNCAGIAPAARIVGRSGAMSLLDFNQVIQVNLVGTFNVMRLCAQEMMRQEPVDEKGERGVIVNTASVAAYEGQVGQAAYSASKAGVAAMTLPAAREFSAKGVRVMTIAPGVMATPMMANMPEAVQEHLASDVPFPKRLGDPAEYASLVQHIIENSYLNGSVIRLDGALRLSDKA